MQEWMGVGMTYLPIFNKLLRDQKKSFQSDLETTIQEFVENPTPVTDNRARQSIIDFRAAFCQGNSILARRDKKYVQAYENDYHEHRDSLMRRGG